MKEMPEHGQEFYLLYIPDKEQKQHPATFIMNETPTHVFSNEFCEIFKNTLIIEHIRATAFKEM